MAKARSADVAGGIVVTLSLATLLWGDRSLPIIGTPQAAVTHGFQSLAVVVATLHLVPRFGRLEVGTVRYRSWLTGRLYYILLTSTALVTALMAHHDPTLLLFTPPLYAIAVVAVVYAGEYGWVPTMIAGYLLLYAIPILTMSSEVFLAVFVAMAAASGLYLTKGPRLPA